MACTPSLGHFIGRREPSTYRDLSRKARISGRILLDCNLY